MVSRKVWRWDDTIAFDQPGKFFNAAFEGDS